MASVIDICNSALYKVGCDRISTLTEQNKRAKICNDIYSKIRDATLRSHPWNFATKRIQLAQDSTAPVFGFDYQYQLPSDCLIVRGVSNDSSMGTSRNIDYKIEGDKLLSNETAIYIEYTFKETNTTNYDANFVDALAYRLAIELAYPLVQSLSLVDRIKKDYKDWMADARTFDAQEGRPEDLIDDVWLNSRLLGSNADETIWRETR
jgi:hypothetical protein